MARTPPLPSAAAAAAPHPPDRGPSVGVLTGLGADLGRLFDHLTRRRGGITFSQYQLLALLRATHPTPWEPWEIGRGLRSGSAQVTALLDHLERAGLVRRRAHRDDGRRRQVVLTASGVERSDDLGARVRALEEQVLAAALSAPEAARLIDLASRLRAVLGEVDPDVTFALTADPGHPPDAGSL